MHRKRPNRRDFLTSTAMVSVTVIIAGSGLVAGCSESPELPANGDADAHNKETLTRFARHLYPHNDVGEAAYSEIANQLTTGADANSPFNQSLSIGADALDAARDTPWLSLAHSDQIAVMKEQEAQPYFGALQAPVRFNLYEHPAVWKASATMDHQRNLAVLLIVASTISTGCRRGTDGAQL